MMEDDLSVLQKRLREIIQMGWMPTHRPGNDGGIGNTLEDLLDVAENNLQLPDFGGWELKSQRESTSSLLTLFHLEPKPRNAKIVSRILLPNYGWKHKQAGTLYPESERSFRATINTTAYSERGFKVVIDYPNQLVKTSFDFSKIDSAHDEWRCFIANSIGTGDIEPVPYWEFSDIEKKLKTKLNNLMYVQAESKKLDGQEYFCYKHIEAYMEPSLENFLKIMEQGKIYIDFDARTGHNHGTKYRIVPSAKKDIYNTKIEV